MNINLPNILTLSRIPILFLIVGLLYLDWPGTATLAFLLFLVAALTDWLDGYIARKFKLVSTFGTLMDALTDKIINVGILIALLTVGIIPKWSIILVLMILSREFLITGLRLIAAGKGVILAAEKSGKIKTVFQIIALSVLLFVPVVDNELDAIIVFNLSGIAHLLYQIGMALLIVATALTVSSGISYIVKYWDLLSETETHLK